MAQTKARSRVKRSKPPSHQRHGGELSPRRRLGTEILPTVVLVVGAIYFLIPIVWVFVAATKGPGELFRPPSYGVGTGLIENWKGFIGYQGGIFVKWARNSAVYSGLGALLSTMVSAMAGFALAKYRFRGRTVVFVLLLGGVLLPQITLVIPQYLLWSQVGLTNSYASMLLPSIVSPFGIYLATIYAMASVPDDIIEASRVDGASELRTFITMGIPMMLPGLATVFLLQFVNIWNNFLLPFVMLADDGLYPITMGLFVILVRGTGESVLYTVAIFGSAVSIVPLILIVMLLQRFWKLELLSGGLKG